MRIGAGELDRRVTILRAATVDDGFATTPGVPAAVGTRWARKLDASDGEKMRASEQGQEITTRFLVRSDPLTRTITGKDQLVCRGLTYQVTGTKESRYRDDGIEVTAVARPDQVVADPAP